MPEALNKLLKRLAKTKQKASEPTPIIQPVTPVQAAGFAMACFD